MVRTHNMAPRSHDIGRDITTMIRATAKFLECVVFSLASFMLFKGLRWLLEWLIEVYVRSLCWVLFILPSFFYEKPKKMLSCFPFPFELPASHPLLFFITHVSLGQIRWLKMLREVKRKYFKIVKLDFQISRRRKQESAENRTCCCCLIGVSILNFKSSNLVQFLAKLDDLKCFGNIS